MNVVYGPLTLDEFRAALGLPVVEDLVYPKTKSDEEYERLRPPKSDDRDARFMARIAAEAAQGYAKPYTEGTPDEGAAFERLSEAIDDLIGAVELKLAEAALAAARRGAR